MSTLIARYFGTATADIGATATAEASPANAMTCVKPFTIPDKWIEKQTPPWDPDDTLRHRTTTRASRSPIRTSTSRPDRPGNYTGYNAERDTRHADHAPGRQRATRSRRASTSRRSMPATTGRRRLPLEHRQLQYDDDEFGRPVVAEPGMMAGPDDAGHGGSHRARIRRPTGTATTRRWSARSTRARASFAIPLFDPVFYDTGKRNGRNAISKFVN